MCRCQGKLKLKKLRLAVRRWGKRYAKFKAASRSISDEQGECVVCCCVCVCARAILSTRCQGLAPSTIRKWKIPYLQLPQEIPISATWSARPNHNCGMAGMQHRGAWQGSAQRFC